MIVALIHENFQNGLQCPDQLKNERLLRNLRAHRLIVKPMASLLDRMMEAHGEACR